MSPTTLLLAVFVTLYALRFVAAVVQLVARWIVRKADAIEREQARRVRDALEAEPQPFDAYERREVATALLAAWSNGDASLVEPVMIAKAYHDADAILAAADKDPDDVIAAAVPALKDSEINATAARAFSLAAEKNEGVRS